MLRWNNSYSSIHSSICNHWRCRKYTINCWTWNRFTVIPNVGGAAQTGISTRAFVGGSTFVGLSTNPGDKEFVSFFVHYNGGTNTDANSYDIFVTKNGQFRPGSVGV